MFVRFSLVSALVASVFAISTAQGETQRDLEFTNPNDKKTYGFVECRWKRQPSVQERAGAAGMTYSITNAIAECMADAPRSRPPVYPADWTEITNVRCNDKKRENLSVRACLRQHQGRLQARDGYFTFEHPALDSDSRPARPKSSTRGAGAGS